MGLLTVAACLLIGVVLFPEVSSYAYTFRKRYYEPAELYDDNFDAPSLNRALDVIQRKRKSLDDSPPESDILHRPYQFKKRLAIRKNQEDDMRDVLANAIVQFGAREVDRDDMENLFQGDGKNEKKKKRDDLDHESERRREFQFIMGAEGQKRKKSENYGRLRYDDDDNKNEQQERLHKVFAEIKAAEDIDNSENMEGNNSENDSEEGEEEVEEEEDDVESEGEQSKEDMNEWLFNLFKNEMNKDLEYEKQRRLEAENDNDDIEDESDNDNEAPYIVDSLENGAEPEDSEESSEEVLDSVVDALNDIETAALDQALSEIQIAQSQRLSAEEDPNLESEFEKLRLAYDAEKLIEALESYTMNNEDFEDDEEYEEEESDFAPPFRYDTQMPYSFEAAPNELIRKRQYLSNRGERWWNQPLPNNIAVAYPDRRKKQVAFPGTRYSPKDEIFYRRRRQWEDDDECPAVDDMVTNCGVAVDAGAPPEVVDFFMNTCNKHEVCYTCGYDYGVERDDCDRGFMEEVSQMCADSDDDSCVVSAGNMLIAVMKHHYFGRDTPRLCRVDCVVDYVMGDDEGEIAEIKKRRRK